MKNVVIIGAYGGMGRAVTDAMASAGYRVFALDKNVGEERENIIPIKVDVTSRQSVEDAKNKVLEYTDSIYAILNFAGVYMLDSLVEMSEEDIHKIFNINLFGAYLVNKAFAHMIVRGGRIIITTSELAPLDPLPFTGVYAISKAALDKYAYSLAMELQLLDIKVSVLRAGAVDTGMISASTEALDRFCNQTKVYSCNAKRFKKIVDSVEARRIPPEKIAKKVQKILSRKHPRFAYSINRNPLLLILDAMPKPFQLWVIKNILK